MIEEAHSLELCKLASQGMAVTKRVPYVDIAKGIGIRDEMLWMREIIVNQHAT